MVFGGYSVRMYRIFMFFGGVLNGTESFQTKCHPPLTSVPLVRSPPLMAHLTTLFLPITAKLGATATGETESDDFTLGSEEAPTTTTTTTPAKGPGSPLLPCSSSSSPSPGPPESPEPAPPRPWTLKKRKRTPDGPVKPRPRPAPSPVPVLRPPVTWKAVHFLDRPGDSAECPIDLTE